MDASLDGQVLDQDTAKQLRAWLGRSRKDANRVVLETLTRNQAELERVVCGKTEDTADVIDMLVAARKDLELERDLVESARFRLFYAVGQVVSRSEAGA